MSYAYIPQIEMDKYGYIIPFDDPNQGIAALYLQGIDESSQFWSEIMEIQDDYNSLAEEYDELSSEVSNNWNDSRKDVIWDELNRTLRCLSVTIYKHIKQKLEDSSEKTET